MDAPATPSPVRNRPVLPSTCPTGANAASRRTRGRLPRRPHSLRTTTKVLLKNDMIQKSVIGSGLKITCSRDELVAEARRRRRAASRRARPCRSSAGILLRGRGRQARRSPRPTWSSRCARSLEAQVEGDGAVVVPGRAAASTCRGCCPTSEVEIEHRAEEGIVQIVCGPARVPAAHLRAEDFPRLPELDARRSTRSSADALLDDPRPRQPRRLARRVAPGADRHPGPLRGGQARDGRDRLVPAVGQGDAGRAATCPELEAIVPARALDEVQPHRRPAATSSSSASRRTRSSSASTATWLTTRRIDGPVPELSTQLLPEGVRARGDAPARGAARRRPPHRR